MVKSVFVLVTADTCSHCREFKRSVWPELKVKLSMDDRISKIVEIPFPTTSIKLDSRYPKELASWIQWYPSIMLFTERSWNSGHLEGVLYGARRINNNFIEDRTVPARTAEGIMRWIEQQYKDNPLFNQSVGTVSEVGSVVLSKNKVKYVYKRKK